MTAKSELEFIPHLMLKIVKAISPNERWQKLYVKWMNIINYAIVCGVGMSINSIILRWLTMLVPSYVANFGAIVVTFLFLYTMTVGSLGYLWGFSSKPKTKKETKEK